MKVRTDMIEKDIGTKRLCLRQWRQDDAIPFIKVINQPHIQQWLPDWHAPEEWIAGWIDRVREHDETSDPLQAFMSWAIVLRDSGRLIGQINLGGDDFDGNKPGTGYFLSADYLGRGYMTEAVSALTGYAFERWNYPEIGALVQPDNRASVRVIEKSGFRFVGTVTKQLDGHPAPCAFAHWILNRPS